jgi:hypothetical protein
MSTHRIPPGHPGSHHRSRTGRLRRALEQQPWWAATLLELANVLNRPWLSALVWAALTGLAAAGARRFPDPRESAGPSRDRNGSETFPRKARISPGFSPEFTTGKGFPFFQAAGRSGTPAGKQWGGDFEDGVSHHFLGAAPDRHPRLIGEIAELGHVS